MRLSAISIGYAVPWIDFDATVHSVFRTAVNIRPANNDLLLTLTVASEADLPQGIRLDTPEGFSFEILKVGREVICRNGSLVFENSNLVVEFTPGKRWQCDLPSLRTDLANPAVRQAWNSAWQRLNERQVSTGAEIVAEDLITSDELKLSGISKRAVEGIRNLLEATRHYQMDDLAALTALIGLGTGLTPSGDDILGGYMAGLWCTVRNIAKRSHFMSKLGQEVIQLSGRTNDISRTYLYHAAYGQVSNRLERLAREISRPESPDQLLSAAESAMQSGHTSGMDTVTGLLLGLQAWEE